MPNHDDAGDYHGLQPRRQAALSAPAGHPRCRYYGNSHFILRATGRLLTSGGNECALIFDAHAPCEMECAGMDPSEGRCPRAIAWAASGQKP